MVLWALDLWCHLAGCSRFFCGLLLLGLLLLLEAVLLGHSCNSCTLYYWQLYEILFQGPVELWYCCRTEDCTGVLFEWIIFGHMHRTQHLTVITWLLQLKYTPIGLLILIYYLSHREAMLRIGFQFMRLWGYLANISQLVFITLRPIALEPLHATANNSK